MRFSEQVDFPIKNISHEIRVIVGGKELPKDAAIRLAFPNSTNIENYGFKVQGEDLQIRKYNFAPK